MITREFICSYHADYGEKGFKPTWMQNADPLWGMAIPHDILEHPAHCGLRNPVEDELMAHGGIYWLRGETGWFNRRGNVIPIHDHLASDWPDIILKIDMGELEAPRTPPPLKFDHDGALDVFTATLNEVTRELKERADGRPEDEPYEPIMLTERRNMIGWLCHGYVYTRRRYRHCDQYMLSCLFSDIAEDANKQLVHAEEGDKYRVSISLRRMEFTSKLIHREDE